MPRKESEVVPEGNGPVPQQVELGFGQPILTDVYRLFEGTFERQLTGDEVGQTHGDDERNKTVFSRPGARCLAATSCHGGRRASRH